MTSGVEYITASSTTSRKTVTVPYGGLLVQAPTIQLNYRAQDVGSTSALPSSTSTSGSEKTAPPASSSSPNISGGAIAGIVVGILAVCAAVGVAVFLIARRRKQKQLGTTGQSDYPSQEPGVDKTATSPATAGNTAYEKPELMGSAAPEDTRFHAELEPQQQYPMELMGSTVFTEADSRSVPQELRGE